MNDHHILVCGKGCGKCEEMRKQLGISQEAFKAMTDETDRLLKEATKRKDAREHFDYVMWATGAYDP